MAKPRISDAQKKLAGTFRANRGEASLFHGRTRLEVEIPPPSDLDADTQREWRIHMRLCVEAGTINHTTLRTFTAMCRAAAALEKSYAMAMKSGPTTRTKDGALKPSPAWTGYLGADAAYARWARQFGLTPMQAKSLPQLPTAGAPLRVVEA